MSPFLGPPPRFSAAAYVSSHIWRFAGLHARARGLLAGTHQPDMLGLEPFPWSRLVLNDLSLAEFTEAADPFALFELWLAEAAASEINDPEAMTLATVDADGLPDARMILCKGADDRGLVFYSNVESAKGRELMDQPRAAALFHWKSLRRQARFRGAVAELTGPESDAYFATRPRGSQIGAWASQQSRPLASRAALEAAVETYERRFGRIGLGKATALSIASSLNIQAESKSSKIEPSRPKAQPNYSKEKAWISLDWLRRNERFQ